MCYAQEFPATVEEWMESNKIVDTEHIYTNGSEMVPIFRMRQWFQHVAAQKGQRWIPVTKRLPEEIGTYWVQLDSGHMCECRWTDVNPFWTDIQTYPHWNSFDITPHAKVIAWMPLPEPYGEGE